MLRNLAACAILTAGGCSLTPPDPWGCPDSPAGRWAETLRPVELQYADRELRFRFVDERFRAAAAYRIDLHAVYAECVGASEPFSAPIPAVGPGAYVIVVECARLAEAGLYVASWSVSALDASGATRWYSQATPITLQDLEQIKAACGQ